MSRAPQAVLFDLDGTLLDTAPDLARALNRVLEQDGRAPLPYAAIRPHVSHGSYALTALACDDPPESAAFEARRRRLLEIYRAGVATETRLFEGMAAVLERIEASGRRWGIVTNKPGWLTTPLLGALDLHRRAACVISGDSTQRTKPHPEPLLAAARALELPCAACLYVGDAQRDVDAAHAAGMAVVVALYGYIGPDEDPASWGAAGSVRSPDELLGWL